MDRSTSELDNALHRSVMKREAVKEQEWQEERKRKDEEFLSLVGTTEMSEEELKKIVESDRRMYYRTVHLNDKLYIHFKGWREMRCLEGWTGLRALYAESNAFDKIQGLQFCTNLKSLFLQENCIKQISGLENCVNLWTLNLSSNFIERIENLSHLKKLNTLTISKNKIGLGGVDDLVELVDTNIHSLDIQSNLIHDQDVVPEVLMRMPDLRVLYMKDNPCCKTIINYRKGITVTCKELRYLDDRPVFEDDRRAAEAFNRGGLAEEREERRRMRDEKNDAHRRNMEAFNAMIERCRREKRERNAMQAEDKYTEETDPVESYEKRMARQYKKWEEDNADDLKDDAKEYAEKCLKAEKEGGEVSGSGLLKDPLLDPNDPAAANTVEEPNTEEKPTENRKLVYEDLWDDVPQLSAAAKPAPVPAAKGGGSSATGPSSGAGAPKDEGFEPSSTFTGARPGFVFKLGTSGLGYYRDEVSEGSEVGAVGLDCVRPSSDAAAVRCKADLGVIEKVSLSSTGDEEKDSWYSRYREKANKVQANLEFQASPQPTTSTADIVAAAVAKTEAALEAADERSHSCTAAGAGFSHELPGKTQPAGSAGALAFRPPPRAVHNELAEMD